MIPLLLLLLQVPPPAQAVPAAPPPPSAVAPDPQSAVAPAAPAAVPTLVPVPPVEYAVGPGDVLEVTGFDNPDLSRIPTVQTNGAISLPLLGEVQVAGLTVAEIQRKVTNLLAKDYLQNPQVEVKVREYQSQFVSVRAPAAGSVLLARPLTLPGETVEFDHGQGVVSVLQHLSQVAVRVGDTVAGAALVGLSGNTGLTSEPLVQWRVYLHGVAVDPTVLGPLL